MERQDLSCTYLAHHELESTNITIIIIITIVIIIIITADLMPDPWLETDLCRCAQLPVTVCTAKSQIAHRTIYLAHIHNHQASSWTYWEARQMSVNVVRCSL